MMFQGIGKRNWSPDLGTVYFWGSGAYAQVTVFNDHLDYWTPEIQTPIIPILIQEQQEVSISFEIRPHKKVTDTCKVPLIAV